MARVKRGNVSRKRHKKILKITKGFRGAASRLFKVANQAAMHALQHAYEDRRKRRRNLRRLWTIRINAAARMQGISYSQLINGLNKAKIEINRKFLADLAVTAPEAFADIAGKAKQALAA
ncbi:MAG: 50S ribosomal protein L20 [Vampirovibrionales bacterium]|nr:50S ribosomal protein L20 [Vampirovibrionales bacterium]